MKYEIILQKKCTKKESESILGSTTENSGYIK